MDIHDALTAEHDQLRALIKKISGLRASSSPALEELLDQLKTAIRKHFAREEVYYRAIDKDARFAKPGFVHQLRNDHAGMIFGMESLLIRLKKKGPVVEWWAHFDKLMDVFVPHMKEEEEALFPEAERVLTPAEWQTIREGLAAL